MVFRIRYQKQDAGHCHCLLYVATAPDRTFALAGTFALKLEELVEFEKQCPKIQFRSGLGEAPPMISKAPG